MLIRWPSVRHSTDTDLLFSKANLDQAVTSLITAVTTSINDPFDPITFVHTGTSSIAGTDRQTCKVKFEVKFGLKTVHQVVSVDVVVADHLLHNVATEPLIPPFDSGCEIWPEVRVYPIEDHVADKLCAMYGHYGNSGSSRYKDLVDLVIIALKTNLDAKITHKALHKEASRRTQAGKTVLFPALFQVPGHGWVDGYSSQAKEVRDLPREFRTLSGAHALIDAFVTPLLQKTPPTGHWSCTNHLWGN